jgi:hypothetical protein
VAEADWTYLKDGLDLAAVARGVTAGIARPPGGGQFLFGFNSLAAVQGAAGLFVSIQNFAPMPKGGSIRACLQRGPSGGPTGFSPFLFLSAQGPSVNDTAYLLGLSDDDPHRIVLRKAPIALGAGAAADLGILLRSADSFAQGTWLHLRLDVIANPNGDVVLAVFQNDLATHALGTAPDWVPVNGMQSFIDDRLAVNTGSMPLTSGRGGFGCAVKDTTRRSFFDALEVLAQTA